MYRLIADQRKSVLTRFYIAYAREWFS